MGVDGKIINQLLSVVKRVAWSVVETACRYLDEEWEIESSMLSVQAMELEAACRLCEEWILDSSMLSGRAINNKL